MRVRAGVRSSLCEQQTVPGRVSIFSWLANARCGGFQVSHTHPTPNQPFPAGALFVAAAGNEYTCNDDQVTYPAGYKLDNVVSGRFWLKRAV